MKFVKVTPLSKDLITGYYKKLNNIVLNIDHIVWYDKNLDEVKVTLTNGVITISHTDISRIEQMFHEAY